MNKLPFAIARLNFRHIAWCALKNKLHSSSSGINLTVALGSKPLLSSNMFLCIINKGTALLLSSDRICWKTKIVQTFIRKCIFWPYITTDSKLLATMYYYYCNVLWIFKYDFYTLSLVYGFGGSYWFTVYLSESDMTKPISFVLQISPTFICSSALVYDFADKSDKCGFGGSLCRFVCQRWLSKRVSVMLRKSIWLKCFFHSYT